MGKKRHLSINIDSEALAKLHYVSKYEGRSASGQIMYLINTCIRNFEKEHGAIETEEESDGK